MAIPLFVLPFAILIGLMLGALGSGGAILALPTLVYGAGLETRQAIAVSQFVVGSAALVGTVLRSRGGLVMWRQALLFGLIGVPAARLGSWVNQRIDGPVLLVFFALMVTASGLRMLTRLEEKPASNDMDVPVCLAAGLVVGFLTGLLGVGGGFLLVPALIAFGGLTARQATATSLPVIAANSLSGAVLQRELWLPLWGLACSFLAATLVGTVLGMYFSRGTSDLKLKQALGVVLILVGLGVVGANLWRS